jgi:hypothetical protein
VDWPETEAPYVTVARLHLTRGGGGLLDGALQEQAESALREQLSKIEQHPDFKQETLDQYKAKKATFQESAHPDQTFPAPKYLQGALSLGEVMQLASAFIQVQLAIGATDSPLVSSVTVCGVVTGMTITARHPSRCADSATPCA